MRDLDKIPPILTIFHIMSRDSFTLLILLPSFHVFVFLFQFCQVTCSCHRNLYVVKSQKSRNVKRTRMTRIERIYLCPTETFMVEEVRCVNSTLFSTRLGVSYLDLSHLQLNLNYPSAALHSVFALCSSYSLISVYAKSSPLVIYM